MAPDPPGSSLLCAVFVFPVSLCAHSGLWNVQADNPAAHVCCDNMPAPEVPLRQQQTVQGFPKCGRARLDATRSGKSQLK